VVVFPLAYALALVFRPRATWRELAARPAPVAALLFGYALPLATIGAVATFLALRVVGIPFPHGVRHTSAATAFAQAGLSLATALAGVPLMAAIVTALAPLFETRSDFAKSLRVTVYALTPGWLGAAFLAYPPLGSLQLVGALYGIYELALGLSSVLGAPARRAPMFAVVAATASFLAGFGLGIAFGLAGAALR
jgi:hypothetical protein